MFLELIVNCIIAQGALLQLEVEGSGFLYRQVRNMVNHSVLSVYDPCSETLSISPVYSQPHLLHGGYCLHNGSLTGKSICLISSLQVALLLQIGREAIPPNIVPWILATRDRKELAKYALSAPPHGLCLMSVKYNEEHLQLPSGCPATSHGRHHTVRKCKLPFY